jgi:adenylyltransferase/sulfurtransferase
MPFHHLYGHAPPLSVIHGYHFEHAPGWRAVLRWAADVRESFMDLTGDLRPEARLRYARQLMMPEFGEEGQRRLSAARVMIVGAGGLGSPCAMYLAAAGTGTLGIVDADSVEVSNLQRQIIHGMHSLGRNKVSSAAEKLADLNPGVKVETYPLRLDANNATGLFSRYDLVLDCTDNLPTRLIVNDSCVRAQKTEVFAAIWHYHGQATVFTPGKGCYRCLFPKADAAATRGPIGVIGVAPGMMGAIQAAEAIKIITGQGRTLENRLLLCDLLHMDFHDLAWRRNTGCPVCGRASSAGSPATG